MRKIVSLFACIYITTSQMALADEAWDFDNMAIVESGDVDITAEDIELNDGADTATVSDFDIAGIMLGMSFEDIYTLFVRNNGLYAPRKENAVIYTIHPDWKYNLDYECRQGGTVIPAELENIDGIKFLLFDCLKRFINDDIFRKYRHFCSNFEVVEHGNFGKFDFFAFEFFCAYGSFNAVNDKFGGNKFFFAALGVT